MDRINNPFSPGAGSPPPALAGRESIIEQAEILFGRIKNKRPEKSLILTGLRGVGKTVLLNQMEYMARSIGYRTILIEAHEGKPLAALIAPHLRRLLFDLDRGAAIGNKAHRAITVLKSFISGIKVSIGEVELGLDIPSEPGIADSGDLEIDLPELFTAVAEAAQEQDTAIALLIDELQYCRQTELSALIMAMHRMQQRQLPLLLVGAGLPILPGLAGESKSYAERLFSFPDIGPLPEQDAEKAVREPIQKQGESINDDAIAEIFRLTYGYPYFLQEWGYQSWNFAPASPITREIVLSASAIAQKRLDDNFFRVRFDRLTPREKKYLRVMAELGPGECRTSDIAERLGIKPTAAGPLRAALIKKGMIYSPSHGNMAFTVPLFDDFMKRAIPVL